MWLVQRYNFLLLRGEFYIHKGKRSNSQPRFNVFHLEITLPKIEAIEEPIEDT